MIPYSWEGEKQSLVSGSREIVLGLMLGTSLTIRNNPIYWSTGMFLSLRLLVRQNVSEKFIQNAKYLWENICFSVRLRRSGCPYSLFPIFSQFYGSLYFWPFFMVFPQWNSCMAVYKCATCQPKRLICRSILLLTHQTSTWTNSLITAASRVLKDHLIQWCHSTQDGLERKS